MKLIVNVVKTEEHTYEFVLENGKVVGRIHPHPFKDGLYNYTRGVYGAGTGMLLEKAFASIKKSIIDFFSEYGIDVEYIEK